VIRSWIDATTAMGKPWADHGQSRAAGARPERRKPCYRRGFLERTTGLEPATLTLAKKKVMVFVRGDRSAPLNRLYSAD
jgi:hypothetical protein